MAMLLLTGCRTLRKTGKVLVALDHPNAVKGPANADEGQVECDGIPSNPLRADIPGYGSKVDGPTLKMHARLSPDKYDQRNLKTC